MKIPYVFKRCSKCGEWKVVNEVNFGKCKSSKDGYQGWCKVCFKEYQHSNKGKAVSKKAFKKYQQSEKGKKARKKAQRKYDQSEKGKAYIKEYNHSDKGKQANKKYRQSEKGKQTNKKYNESEKGQVVAFNGQQRYRLKAQNQGRGITTEQWKEMMDFFGWKCAYSGITLLKKNRSIDHIVPISKGGENEIWNIVPMLKSYNSSKNNKDIITWYKEQDFYSEERLNKINEWQEYAYNKYGLNDEII